MGEPVEPGPLVGALLGGAAAVGADEDDFEGAGRVQRAELGQHRAGQAGQPGPGAGQAQYVRVRVAQVDGEGHGRQRAEAVLGGQVRGAEPDGEGVRVPGAALPQAGAGAQGGEQHGGRVGPALAQGVGLGGVAGGVGRVHRLGCLGTPGAARRQLAGPGTYGLGHGAGGARRLGQPYDAGGLRPGVVRPGRADRADRRLGRRHRWRERHRWPGRRGRQRG